MVEKKKDTTEEKILAAAQSVFIRKGMDGTRMQEIADEAGINKALLHYYFRSKQKLFEAIFNKAFAQILPDIINMVDSEKTFIEKLNIFIDNYFDLLMKNPFLPGFIIKEINRDSDLIVSVFKKQGINPSIFLEVAKQEMEKGKIRKMDPRELIINILAMCIFPFAARPLMEIIFFNNDEKAYQDFLIQRKNNVKEFVLKSINEAWVN
ncbi:MAG TPA: TetR/AcrR family transcriptional regulator [Mariniphaga sp.]|nr:TetR/AcrR family transcriptional regulator [Mariniphaga sp.]